MMILFVSLLNISSSLCATDADFYREQIKKHPKAYRSFEDRKFQLKQRANVKKRRKEVLLLRSSLSSEDILRQSLSKRRGSMIGR